MGKDGAGGGSYSNTTYSIPTSTPTRVFDLHIATLKLLGSEMERMHQLIKADAGDTDTSQEMLATLQEELIRLSQSLDEKDIAE